MDLEINHESFRDASSTFDLRPYTERIRKLFQRHATNPILGPEDAPIPCKAVCNPGACLFEDDVLLLLRVIDEHDHSHLFVARSKNGIDDWRIEPEPLLSPKSGEWYDAWGCEDARITSCPESGDYIIAYAGYSHFGAGVCLARTRDFKTVERLGLVIHPYNKDAVVLPERIDGKYWMLHRPTMASLEDIWISESDDLLHWGAPRCVLEESDRPGWQGGKIGAGPTPIRFGEGWLMIYHGVERTGDHWVYRTGIALLKCDEPYRLLGRWPEWVLGPQESYEYDDRGQGIVFPTGLVTRDGRLMMYYGAGDRSVGLVTADLAQLEAFDDEFRREALPRLQGAPETSGDRPVERA